MKSDQILLLISLLLIFSGCKKEKGTPVVNDNTYTLYLTNISGASTEGELTIETSLQSRTTFIIKGNSDKKINILASPGEYVQFILSKAALSISKITDARGTIIANYDGRGSSPNGSKTLSFIAFDVNDPDKDLLRFKTGKAEEFTKHLFDTPYHLKERFTLDDKGDTLANPFSYDCSYSDIYEFTPYPGEMSDNFNPEKLIFTTNVDLSQSDCGNYRPNEGDYPSLSFAVLISNNSNETEFYIWDPMSIDGGNGDFIPVKFTVEPIGDSGVFRLYRTDNEGNKEFFVFAPLG